MKRFDSSLTRVLRLRQQQRHISELALAGHLAALREVREELSRTQGRLAEDRAAVSEALGGRRFGAAAIQCGVAQLQHHLDRLAQLEQQESERARVAAEAQRKVQRLKMRETAVERLLDEQRAQHRREQLRDEQIALDEHALRRRFAVAVNQVRADSDG